MLRQLLVIIFVMSLGWLLRRIFGAVAAARTTHSGTVVPEKTGPELVRDRICNTFLPRSSALSSEVAGEQHFFCSENCRRTFLEGR